jgi:peptidoglycan/LPS O-acetylase OafA/YrhL
VPIAGDPYYYHHGANLLADGEGFPHPFRLLEDHQRVAGADHPPGYIIVLAAASLVGLRSFLAHQLWSCVLGAAAVAMTGIAGRRVAGPRVGLLAAGIAAVYPNFWFNDGLVMSETLILLVASTTIWVAYRFWDRPSRGTALALGAVVGVATLTRAESTLLVVLLVIPLALLVRTVSMRERILLATIGTVAAATIVAPWVLYNLARFEEPVTLSSQLGPTLQVANCDDTFYGPDHSGRTIGFWSYPCIAQLTPPAGDPSVQEVYFRDRALDYIREHERRLPVVMGARVLRTWGLFAPLEQINLDRIETRELPASRVGLAMYYALAAGSIAGVVILRRRKVPVLPLLAPIAGVTIMVAFVYGTTRFRAIAEPSLVILGAVALDHAFTRWRASRTHTRSEETPAPRVEADVPLEPVGGLESAARPLDAPVRFPCFDGLRAIAAGGVLLVHVALLSGFNARHGATYGPYFARAEMGVALFFVISGFLLYRPFVGRAMDDRAGPAVRPYLRRRALRIIPAYWVALTLLVVVFDVRERDDINNLADVIVYYGFLQIYFDSYVTGGIQQAWSLCTEVAFYLFLPLWAVAMRAIARARGHLVATELAALALMYAGAMAFRMWIVADLPPHNTAVEGRLDWLPANADLFALGMAVAVVYAWAERQPTVPPWLAWAGRVPWLWWLLAGVSFWAVCTQVDLPLGVGADSPAEWFWRQVLYGTTALFLLLPAVFGPQDRGAIRRFLTTRVVMWLGLVSYGIYLWHEAALDVIRRAYDLAPFTGSFLPMLAGVVALSIAAAALSYVVVERPALRRKEPRPPSEPAAPLEPVATRG